MMAATMPMFLPHVPMAIMDTLPTHARRMATTALSGSIAASSLAPAPGMVTVGADTTAAAGVETIAAGVIVAAGKATTAAGAVIVAVGAVIMVAGAAEIVDAAAGVAETMVVAAGAADVATSVVASTAAAVASTAADTVVADATNQQHTPSQRLPSLAAAFA